MLKSILKLKQSQKNQIAQRLFASASKEHTKEVYNMEKALEAGEYIDDGSANPRGSSSLDQLFQKIQNSQYKAENTEIN